MGPYRKLVMLNSEKKGRIGYKNSGVLFIDSCVGNNSVTSIPAINFMLKFNGKNLDRKDLNMKSGILFIFILY